MKRLMSLFAILTLILGLLAACGNDNGDSEADSDPNVIEEESHSHDHSHDVVSSDSDPNAIEEEPHSHAHDHEHDVVSSASVSDNPDNLVKTMSPEGSWIFQATGDITLTENLDVSGVFHDLGDESKDVFRMLSTGEFILTLPNMIVTSPNFRIHIGNVKGNIHAHSEGFRVHQSTVTGDIRVHAKGFSLTESTVEGNVMFDSQELKDSANLETGTVTGQVIVLE